MEALVFLLLVALALALVIIVPRYRRKRLLARPFPRQWQQILEQNLGVYASFPAPLKKQLQQLIVLFIHEKKFYGCGGLVIDDEIRITVAAEACLLLLNRATSGYNSLQAILVYPSAYRATREQHDSSGVIHSDTHTMLGESWSNGRLILSWDDVQRGVSNFADGQNVVLHEFAHQLDQESGSANGAPVLASGSSYQSWARVLSREFEQLQQRAESNLPSLIDRYGAQNPGEFFAVATETFFERPAQLCQLHPELFEELRQYYCVDPRQWHH
jgi:Mlc titration factor MtfA (ptsG expression regulator)